MADLKWSDLSIESSSWQFSCSLPQKNSINSDRLIDLSRLQRLNSPINSNRSVKQKSPQRLGSSILDCQVWAGDFEEGTRGNNCVENPAYVEAPPKTKTLLLKGSGNLACKNVG